MLRIGRGCSPDDAVRKDASVFRGQAVLRLADGEGDDYGRRRAPGRRQ
ncbi:MAG: hypothetical protein LBP95_14035 [Deltaproteobacteria bacterium]|nr:hypothetical protein [Deltaproteobacteria bacterium]